MREFVTQLLKGRIFENKNLETIAFDYIQLSNRYNLEKKVQEQVYRGLVFYM